MVKQGTSGFVVRPFACGYQCQYAPIRLKYHVAGLADGHDWDGAAKPSRLLLEEREAWCDSNMARIRALSAAMTRGEYPDLPAKLKKPVSFIAACHELARADQIGPDFITHLPMSLR